METLADIATLVGGTVIHCDTRLVVSGVSNNSAETGKDGLFIAIPGAARDGHEFVDDAFSRGACAALVSNPESLRGRPGILVDDPRYAFSRLSSHWYGDPSQKMQTVGITGTNGKTTTNWIVYHLFYLLERSALRVGTLGTEARGIIALGEGLTTPDALYLNRMLATVADQGVQAGVFEVSSHALDQSRVAHISFDVGVFTNLTRDHLDYHQTMEQYYDAKARLISIVAENGKPTRAMVVNTDDPLGGRFAADSREAGLEVLTFGTSPECAVQILSFDQRFSGSTLILGFAGQQFSVESAFIGNHNAQNLAASFGVMLALGHDPATVAAVLGNVPQVPGRLESVGSESLGVYVDYAHTPDALRNVLSALKKLVQNQLWVVFGCGGDRDRGKRPQMAEVAAELADKIVVTSDNPRTEDPQKIIDDILSTGVKPAIVEADRRTAIEKTLVSAVPGDVVVIAGKGHEDYQIIGKNKIHFSDTEEVRRVLQN